MDKVYRVVSNVHDQKDNLTSRVICDCYTEEDAEEVGASMALAGYDVEVWDFDTKIHEFFAS